MQNYQRQKHEPQNKETESRDDSAETAIEPPLVLSPERWSRDPFDSFPMKIEPDMHNQLYLCKSTVPVDQVSTNITLYPGEETC